MLKKLSQFLLGIIILLGYFQPLLSQNNYLVKDIAPGINSSFPYEFTEMGNALYFIAGDYPAQALYKTDGTEAGTEKITGDFEYIQEYIIVSNGKIYMSAQKAIDSNTELYVHSGIAGSPSTKLVVNTVDPLQPNFLQEVNGRVYYFGHISSSPNQWQVGSIDIATDIALNHIAPVPYNGLIFVNEAKGKPMTGYGAFVPLGNLLIYSISGPSGRAILSLDISSPSSPPNLVAAGVSNNNSFGLFPFNGQVYFYDSGELKSTDGLSINTVGNGLNPYYFQTFGGKLYFAGVASANSNHSVLYQIDGSNVLTEFSNIRAEGAIGNIQGIDEYSIQVHNNELYVWINEFPTSGFYHFCKIDFTNPTAPTYSIELSDRPTNMHYLRFASGHFYYTYYNSSSNTFQFKKSNNTFQTVIAEQTSDGDFGEFAFFNGELFYAYKGSESINCNTYGDVGTELHKLTSSQINCINNVVIPASNLIGYEGIFAGNQTIQLTGNVTLNQDRCIMFSTGSISISGNFQVNPPTMIGLITQGCP